MIDLKTFLADAHAAISAAETVAQTLAPVIAKLGIPWVSPAAAVAVSILPAAQALLDRADDLDVAITSDDQADLTALIAKLEAIAEQEEAEAQAAEDAALKPAPS